MRASEVGASFGVKESEVQYGEAPTLASRPSASASGSRGAFSCRRWRLLSGKPKDGDTIDKRVEPTPVEVAPPTVQRPSTADVGSKTWASAATPFATVLPRDTIVPTTSRKSVAAAVLTSACPPENTKKWEREMTLCERKHVKAMGRMATRIYRGKGVGEDPAEPSRRRKTREKQALKDQIYLPVLCQARAGGSRDLSPPRAPKSVQSSPQREVSSQSSENTVELPGALAGMKLLSSQLDELRADLGITSRRTERLWYPQAQRATKTTYSRPSQPSRLAICRIGQPDSGSSSSSLETLLLRVLERPPACPDGYQADHESNIFDHGEPSARQCGKFRLHRQQRGLKKGLGDVDRNRVEEPPKFTRRGDRGVAGEFIPALSTQRPSNQQLSSDTAVTGTMAKNRKQKPASAYQYYQKLVQDFDSLERDMVSHQEEQSELEAQLERAKAKARALKAENQQVQRVQWERERDRQLEMFVHQRATLDTLRAQTEALEAQELRLQAEMEVIHERQQETSETEARRIRRLVHERTTLLEDELAKGKLDLDYIAQVVSSARRQELKQEAQRETNQNAVSSVKNLVQNIQDRRRRDFEVAEANFQARMRSFQLEKEALARKAKELRVTKQRALQILSQNQQQVIKGFFDAPAGIQQREEKAQATPTLDFGEILQSLNQSGAQVEQIQTIDSERNSGRRELADALRDARMTVEHGDQRIEAIKKSLLDRRNEAQKLGITVESPGPNSTGYDGMWGIETYAPRQYETVYFVRGLVFACMDAAVTEVTSQPAKELLEFEVRRWRDTHFSVQHDRHRQRIAQFARQALASLMDEAITEIAADIRLEFESSSLCVRSVVTNALKAVLFPNPAHNFASPHVKRAYARSQPTVPASTSPATLRSSLFGSSFEHLQALRNRRKGSISTTILHQTSLPMSQQHPATVLNPPSVATKSPVKKTFGIFSSSKGAEATLSKKGVPPQTQSSTPADLKSSAAEVIPFLSVDAPKSPPSSATVAMDFWENKPLVHSRTIMVPSPSGYSTCLHVSRNGDLLICGTTEGELIIWDLLPDPPTILRVWSPPKAESSRITRIVLSADSQVVLVFFRRRTVCVFAINPSIRASNTAPPVRSKQAAHSEDCFPVESVKFKPHGLERLVQLSATDALAELPFPADLRERAPNAVAKDPATGWSAAELSCGSFFASSSLTGLTACSTSILCGASTGDLLKINLLPQRARTGVRLHNIQARFDYPGPDANAALDTKTIRREFFRGHRRVILFASYISRKDEESKAPEILSVDQDGIVCMWRYTDEAFTGFGWFKPTLKLRLKLLSSDSTPSTPTASAASASKQPPSKQSPPLPSNFSPGNSKGEALQVALTPDDTRLVFMVFYGDSAKKEVAGTLRFSQLLTASLKLDPVQFDVGFTGGDGAPRFSVTTNFLFLLANNCVRVYTLRTGKEAREPIALPASAKQPPAFSTISCSSSRRADSTTITVAVSGDQHPRILVYAFTTTPQSHEMRIKSKRER